MRITKILCDHCGGEVTYDIRNDILDSHTERLFKAPDKDYCRLCYYARLELAMKAIQKQLGVMP